MGPVAVDTCEIRIGSNTFIEEVYTMPFTSAEVINWKNNDLVKKWGVELLEVAKKRGVQIAGLGVSLKSQKATQSGQYFVGKVDGVYIANGNNNTAQVSVDSGVAAVQKLKGDLENLVIAVVGANGSVGSICSEMASEYASRLVLVGSEKADSVERLEEKLERVKEVSKTRYGRTPEIELSTDLESALKDVDLTYTATDSYRQTVFPEMVKKGSVIVDIARPHDTGKGNGFVERGVLAIDGGLQYYNGDGEWKINFGSMGTPRGYFLACAAEPLILAMAKDRNRNLIQTNIEDALLLRKYSDEFGFQIDKGVFRYHYNPIDHKKMEAIKRNAG